MYIIQVRNMIKRLCYDDGRIKLEASCFTYYEDCRLKCCTGGYDYTLFMMGFASEQALYNQFVNSILNYKFILFTNNVYNQTFSCPAVNISMKNIIDNLINDYPLNVGISDSCQINLGELYIPIETLVGTKITCVLNDYWSNITIPAEGTYWAIKGISFNPTTGIYGADVCRQDAQGNNIECINSIGDNVRTYSSGYMFQVLAIGNIGIKDSEGNPIGYANITVAKPIDLCEGIICNNICIGTDLYSQKCVNGVCVQDQLLEQNSTEYCNYIPPCVPNWQCELPLNGYEKDGCGNRQYNPDCEPPEECIPNWQCELPLNGYEFDGCGNKRYNSDCKPSEECIPNWQCELPLNGYEFDGCGNKRYNSDCEPSEECIPNWQCELGETGYEIDGCGNRRYNPDCELIEECIPNWQCEVINEINTGYKIDTNNCFEKTYDIITCPISKKSSEEESNILLYGIAAGIVAIGLKLLGKNKKVK